MRMGVREAWPLTSWPHPSRPIQSYCLKVKEMDDEEYSCIVSTEGAHVVSGDLGCPPPLLPQKVLGLSEMVGMSGILGS